MICSHLTPEKIHSCLSVPLIDRLMTQPAFSAITHYSVRISLTQSTAYSNCCRPSRRDCELEYKLYIHWRKTSDFPALLTALLANRSNCRGLLKGVGASQWVALP